MRAWELEAERSVEAADETRVTATVRTFHQTTPSAPGWSQASDNLHLRRVNA
jgi:hypothetical protein